MDEPGSDSIEGGLREPGPALSAQVGLTVAVLGWGCMASRAGGHEAHKS